MVDGGFKDEATLFRGKRKLVEDWGKKVADDFRFEKKVSE